MLWPNTDWYCIVLKLLLHDPCRFVDFFHCSGNRSSDVQLVTNLSRAYWSLPLHRIVASYIFAVEALDLC